MEMDEAVGAALALGVLGGYFYLNWFIGTRTAAWIASLFATDKDDEVVGMHEDRGAYHSVWTPVTRGGQRFKYWFFLVIAPAIVFVNYRFWDRIWSGLEWVWTTLVQYAAKFL